MTRIDKASRDAHITKFLLRLEFTDEFSWLSNKKKHLLSIRTCFFSCTKLPMHDVNHASKLDYWASCLCPWGTIQVWRRRHLSMIKAPCYKCYKLLKCQERGTKTTLEQNININSSSVVENALLIQNWHSFLQGQISSGCPWFLSVVVWKGLRRNNF